LDFVENATNATLGAREEEVYLSSGTGQLIEVDRPHIFKFFGLDKAWGGV